MSQILLKNKDRSYEGPLLQELQILYDDKKLCDIVLVADIDGQRFSCHRVVLAACSQFFKAMFTNPMCESQQSEIVLKEVSGEQLKPLLAFCYSGIMELHEDENDIADNTAVMKLMCTASLLQLNTALDACVDYLKEHLTTASCLGIYALAELHSLDQLQYEAEHYTETNFMNVCQHEEFLQMPFEQLAPWIASDNLNVPLEEMVFSNIMCWVRHDELNRQHHISELLKLVRLPLLSSQFLQTEVRPICEQHGCLQLLSDVLFWKSDPALPTPLSLQQTKPRSGCGELLSVDQKGYELSIKIYCPILNRWRNHGEIPVITSWFTFALLKESLMFAYIKKYDIFRLLSYDLKKKKSKELCPMQTGRRGYGLSVLNDMLYAVGGCLNSSHKDNLKSVERYDPVTNTWRFVASMKYSRWGLGVAVLDGLLYAVGGSYLLNYIDYTESYNPLTDQWTERANMNSPRRKFGIAAAHGFLYAIGGQYNNTNLNTVERYDPHNNKWTQLCSVSNPGENVGCAVLGNRLLSYSYYGGPVEEYNLKKNRWSLWKNLDRRGHNLYLISIPKLDL